MDLETIIQSEVSQKDKNKYHILTHTCEIQKSGTGQSICKGETDTQTWRANVWTLGGEGGWDELGDWH